MRLTIVDVFAETPLSGNQLAVVRDAADLAPAAMLNIAREMNFSETTFVLDERHARATVRIFTPEYELPFAGHPTLGTAWVLSGGRGAYTLDLPSGAVPVEFSEGVGWMTPPPVALGDTWEAAPAAALLGLSRSDLDSTYPLRFATVGPAFVLIPVRDLDALRRAKLDEALYRTRLAEARGVQGVFVFSAEPYSNDAEYAARMFFYAGGVREDAATGSANTAFAAYLRTLRGSSSLVVVDQGVEMKRPSRLYLDVRDTIRVGGKVQRVVDGRFHRDSPD